MRDFTKSVFSFSWAMSLFGVQQAVNLFTPSKAKRAFDSITGATREEFGDALEAAFRAGDNLQKGLVDMTFGVFTGQPFNPNSWMRATSDAVQRSAEAVSQGMRAGVSNCQQRPSAGSPCSEGWGPASGSAAPPSYSQSRPQGWEPMPDASAGRN